MKLFPIAARLISAGKKLSDDCLGAFSAQASFFLFVSLFPFIMLLLALLQFFPFNMEDLISAAKAVLPNGITEFVVPTITEIYQKGTPALISVTAVTTVWSASTGMNAIIRGLHRITDSEDSSWLGMRIKSIFCMLGLLLVIIMSLGLFVFGGVALREIKEHLPHLPLRPLVSLLSTGLRWLCGICVLTVIFDLIYLFAPKRKSRFLKELPGAFLAAAGWAGFSYLYSFYINNITNFSVYGSITLVIFFLLWMYVCFYILFLGAEINGFLGGHPRRAVRYLMKQIKD